MSNRIIIDRDEITGIWSVKLIEYSDDKLNKETGLIESKSYPELQKEMSDFIQEVNKNYTHNE